MKQCIKCMAPMPSAQQVCKSCKESQKGLKESQMLKDLKPKHGFHKVLRKQLHAHALKMYAKSGQVAQLVILDFQQDLGKHKANMRGEGH
jgi:predicted amidophosphoribosyltransferase